MSFAQSIPLSLVRFSALMAVTVTVSACGANSPAAETAAAQTSENSSVSVAGRHSGFSLIDDYVLEVEGKVSKEATLYSSSETRALLVISGDLPAPVLLWPGSRRVETLQMLKVSRKQGGFAEILPNPVIAEHPPFRVEPPDVKFVVDGIDAALVPKPPLIGLQGLEAMLDHSAAYGERARSYVPSAGELEKLRASGRPVRVRVFFGSWCPACGQLVPRLMRVVQELGENSTIEVEYYGLPRGFAGEPEAERYGIHSVPSAVVFSGNTEIGRINGDEWRSPEKTLTSLLGLS